MSPHEEAPLVLVLEGEAGLDQRKGVGEYQRRDVGTHRGSWHIWGTKEDKCQGLRNIMDTPWNNVEGGTGDTDTRDFDMEKTAGCLGRTLSNLPSMTLLAAK